MTTNVVESDNMVMRGVRCLPLVGIVEFIMYGCAKYFRDRYHAVSPTVNNPAMVFENRITEYMHKKITKAQQHNVRPMGTRKQRFEVACKDRSRRGVRRERVLQECLLREDGTAACTCHKPKLLHLPCSHVIAACVESGVQPRSFVSPYFTKRQSRRLGSMSYTGSEYLECSLRKIHRYGTFQIMIQRGQALDIGRHVVSGMVWMR